MGVAQVNATVPTGASLFWTSDDPIVKQARKLAEEGQLTEAERLLDADKPATPVQARKEGKEIIRRIRMEYDLDHAGLLAKIQRRLPEITAEDLERWRDAGQVQYRILDGKLCYFGREPSNIYLFCDEAKERIARKEGRDPKIPAPMPEKDRKLIEHIEEVLQAVERTGRSEVVPYKHTIHYQLSVDADRPGAKAGSVVRCWLPFPQEYRWQRNVKLLRTSPNEHVVAPNAIDRWPFGGAPQRTIYLERKIANPSEAIVFEADYEYISYAYYPNLDDSKVRPLPADFPSEYLAERPPHVMFTPEIKAVTQELVGSEKNPLAKARAIFHYIAKLPWAAEHEYGNIRNLSEQLFKARRGDCGTHGLLFMAMCRYAGVPARWQSGWVTAPVDSGMHDWAEFYVEPWGWLPADPTYGLKPSDNPEVREFYFGHQDAYRLIVNLDYGHPLHPPKLDLRSEPLDFQRGEVEIDGRNLYYDEWSYSFKFDQEKADK